MVTNGKYFYINLTANGKKKYSIKVKHDKTGKTLSYEIPIKQFKNITAVEINFSDKLCSVTVDYIKLSSQRTKSDINSDIRDSIRVYPPYRFSIAVNLPKAPYLYFDYAIRNSAWDKSGQGVLFRIFAEHNNKRIMLFEDFLDPQYKKNERRWFDKVINLKKFAKKNITLSFETSADKQAENFALSDYAVFSNPVIFSSKNKKPNIILIGIDTLRADHLGCYGYLRRTSPTIDSIAKNGVLFEQVICQSSWTLPSFTSIFTGLYPFNHNVERQSDIINEKIPTLQKTLSSLGYFTAAYTNGGDISKRLGWDRGFDVFIQNNHHGEDTNSFSFKDYKKQLFDFLSQKKLPPFFLFIHTYDCHAYYDCAPNIYKQMFTNINYKDIHNLKKQRFSDSFLKKNADTITKEDTNHIIGLYDSEIRYIDSLLKEMINLLKKQNLLKNTFIIITSDHGEEFKDHNSFGHNHSLYNELVHVPLIIQGPGIPKNIRIDTKVRSIDIFPTVFDMLGIKNKINSLHIDGLSLMPLIKGDGQMNYLPCISKDWNKFSIRTDKWTQITTKKSSELFNSIDDPKEQKNIIDKNKNIARNLQRKYFEIKKSSSEFHTANSSSKAVINKKVRRELE
ncbi:sulfatase [bacterium]|nr:sulfatase [bacterium]